MIVTPATSNQASTTPAPRAGAVSAAVTPAPSATPAHASADIMRQAVAAANQAVKALANNVQFSLDGETGKMLVRVVDTETGTVIRQIPSEEMLELRRALDRLSGLMIDRTA